MKILLNNIITSLPSDVMSVSEFAKWQNLKTGSAIVINDSLVTKKDWETTILNDLDRVTVISMAFGG